MLHTRWGWQVSFNPPKMLALYLSAEHLNTFEEDKSVQLPCKQAKGQQRAKGKDQRADDSQQMVAS